jgi:hypothetical protein
MIEYAALLLSLNAFAADLSPLAATANPASGG